ncbi:MAG: MFS transporter [Archangium sp.]
MSEVAAPKRTIPPVWKIGLLSTLYFAQGLPFGFQANALPLYLSDLGLSKTKIGLLGALALPWSLKVFWAPFVDRFGSKTFGRRKSWIVPTQLLLAATCAAAALIPLSNDTLVPFLVLILLTNVWAATQDVAVDGLAVDLLEPKELGVGNGAQVVGYKIGMIVGGGLLVSLAAIAGWASLFQSMAILCLLAMLTVLFVKEPEPKAQTDAKEAISTREMFRRIKELVSRPEARWVLLAASTYKVGETLAEAMFGLWLKEEHHIPKEQIAIWIGTWGVVASVSGSALGAVLATRLPLKRAVMLAAAMRVIPLAAQWALAAGFGEPGPHTVIPITCGEHFFGGALTTTMFALMMSQVDRRIAATHYTLLASVEVIGKAGPRLASGWLVDTFNYQPVFALGAVCSVLFLFVIPKIPPPAPPQEVSS